MTEFEKLLQDNCPEIFKLNNMAKFDPKIWEVIDTMVGFIDKNLYGKIEIVYRNGKIDHANKTERFCQTKIA